MEASNPIRVDDTALGTAMGLLSAGPVAVRGLTARRGWGEAWRGLSTDVYLGYDPMGEERSVPAGRSETPSWAHTFSSGCILGFGSQRATADRQSVCT